MGEKYMVLEAQGNMELVSKVQKALNESWHCQGGVTIFAYKTAGVTKTIYYQAMIRKA